jgi:protein-S-isoprenylcysteine O-methyltransferase Ste14
MTFGPDFAISMGWLAWLASWWAAAAWRKQAIKRPPQFQEFVHLTPTVIGVWMLFSTHAPFADPARQVLGGRQHLFEPIQLWSTPIPAGWACFALAVAGFLFCWWARVHLGQLWSGTITLKSGHRVVDTGPYRLVRHPIYTGLILSALATALEKATLLAFGAVVLITFGFWLKARFEEGFLRAELGREAYDAYAAQTPMLIPFKL